MKELINKLQSYAKNCQKERCGVILKDDSIIEITNVSKTNDSFVFSKRQWLTLLNSGTEVKAIWHTHPGGSVEPSEADLKFMRSSKYDSLIVTVDDWRYIKCLET